MARLALPDLPLAFCITLGIWAALEPLDVAGAAAGLGFLMKGPIALVVPGIVLIPIWWRERPHDAFVRDLALTALSSPDRSPVVRGDDARARNRVSSELFRR